jgi:triacylglycerol lipase
MSIAELNFPSQSALFARLSNLAYKSPAEAEKIFRKMGYSTRYISNGGSDAYIVESDTDLIIVCRGTEVKQWSDVSADLSINLTKPLTGTGRVHIGFKHYTDKLWEPISEYIKTKKAQKKTLWVTGHSLGAAMATLIARRCTLDYTLQTPAALFTYGSPRVGNREYINAFNGLVVHHRWVNDGDIVTKVPLPPLYYHCGTMHHISASGVITSGAATKRKFTTGIKFILSFWKGIFNKLLGDAKDHSSEIYVQRLSFWAMNYTEEN